VPVHLRKRRGLPVFDTRKLRRRARRLLKLLGREADELSILLTGDEEMTELNRAYRKRNRTTDVLAFSQLEGQRGHLHREVLGDVVISLPTARRQARERKHSLLDELIILLVHGTLHLLGHEHERTDRKTAAAMRREQERLAALLMGK
jgi:probable rRNA maturation factor